MQITNEDEIERSNGELLAQIVGVDLDTATRVLRKHKGDMDKAADAILNGDTGQEEGMAIWKTTTVTQQSERRNVTPEPTANTTAKPPVIDLTMDEEAEMNRAIEMSKEQAPPEFKVSERAPHPEWQMVRADAPVGVTATPEDHNLNEAIQASLQDFKEEEDPTPFKEALREGNRPIALRPDTPSLAYAALALHALYYVPQVRLNVSNLRLPYVTDHTEPEDPARAMFNLIELFTNLDLAQLAAIVDSSVLSSLKIEPLNNRRLHEATSDAVKHMAALIEHHITEQADGEETEPLFSFTHGQVKKKADQPLSNSKSPSTGFVVGVDIGGGHPQNDLITCVSNGLNLTTPTSSTHEVIIRPSEVVGFSLSRTPNPPGSKSPDLFTYPKTLFMDRFLLDNFELVDAKRQQEYSLRHKMEDKRQMKENLIRHDNQDTLQNLQTTIHYYENVADAGDDPARKRTLEGVANHLKDIVTMINGKVEHLDHEIEELQNEVAALFDCPELQNFQYDLRAVLFHTGLPGRKNIYSYVQDSEGTWWKTVDQEVTEVPEETVLTDPTGIHLNAGPYFLLYSRHLSEEQLREVPEWPALFTAAVEENNRQFLEMMNPGLDITGAGTRREALASSPPPSDMMQATSSPSAPRDLPPLSSPVPPSPSVRHLPTPKEPSRRGTHERKGSRNMPAIPDEQSRHSAAVRISAFVVAAQNGMDLWSKVPARQTRLLEFLELNADERQCLFMETAHEGPNHVARACATKAAIHVFQNDENEANKAAIHKDPGIFAPAILKQIRRRWKANYQSVNEIIGQEAAALPLSSWEPGFSSRSDIMKALSRFPHWQRLHVYWRTLPNFNQFAPGGNSSLNQVTLQEAPRRSSRKRTLAEASDFEWDKDDDDSDWDHAESSSKPKPSKKRGRSASTDGKKRARRFSASGSTTHQAVRFTSPPVIREDTEAPAVEHPASQHEHEGEDGGKDEDVKPSRKVDSGKSAQFEQFFELRMAELRVQELRWQTQRLQEENIARQSEQNQKVLMSFLAEKE